MTTMLRRAALAGAILALLSFPAQAEKLLKINESLGPAAPRSLPSCISRNWSRKAPRVR
jgi:hypothetical protein